MISKYFPLASVLVVTLLLLSSCLNSSTDNVEYSPDAQIYAITLASKSDTAGLLTATRFTIDQINGRIFNKEPLPYLFKVDSVMLTLRSVNSYNPFTQVILTLDSDSSYLWQVYDSVAINRLTRITTTAPDGVTRKEYHFELNIYQEDPYIINWQMLDSDYLPAAPQSQKTVQLNNHLFTYYKRGDSVEAVMTEAGNNLAWSPLNLTGLPPSTDLTTLTVAGEGIYALDPAAHTLYHSSNGINWNVVSSTHTVLAIYGTLPAADGGRLLLAVEQDNRIRFAETSDFTEVVMMNDLPAMFPLSGFSATQVDAPASYSIKYLLLTGGTTADHAISNEIWILQKDNEQISLIHASVPASLNLQGSRLFYYDSKPYLMVLTSEGNRLYISDNFGLEWKQTGENQSFPQEFRVRSNASVFTDSENYIWIFGGISSEQAQITDAWRGRLNKFTGM